MTLRILDVKHSCAIPSLILDHHSVVARWDCPECGQRWQIRTAGPQQEAKRKGGPRRSWRRARAAEFEGRAAKQEPPA